eukprot:TRINITY_DN69547_c0_g1_i2.p1 TRINITY_DN69547_c0_g1~~TRINITY_DN69547_c0_g1_i2.p1  ORF type:complete len:659 (+),score=79.18 TRINITY_DN69547_c0_g1_i2:104-2080(+)
MRCGHRFRGSTQVIALVSSASSCIGVHLSSDPAAAIQASSDLAAASNEGIDLVESDEIGDAWRQESEQGRGQSKGSPCSTLLARGVIGAVLSVPRRASVERDGTVASIFELYSLHGVSSRTNGGFLSFVASVLGLVGGCCFLQLLVRYLFCQMTASAKTSNNRAEEACESVSPAGSASAPDMDGETFGISAVHASLASLREQLGIMLRTDAAEQNDGVVAGETYCTSRIASRADSDAEARHRRDAELLKRTHASLALKCFPTARVMSAQASLDLVFDACFEEMDHVRFSEELLAALRAVGMTDAAVDQLIVELRSGSVIATISGPASVIQDLRKKPLQTLKVMGYSPILFCRGQGGASGEGGMDQSTAALIVQRAYRRWCVSQRHCHAVVLPGMGRTWVLAYRHFRVQQSHWRGQRGRAALMIQAAYRCHSVRLAVRRRVDMRQALRIQRTWRGRRVRQRLRFSACDRIRARKARACVRQLMALAVPIQSLWRGFADASPEVARNHAASGRVNRRRPKASVSCICPCQDTCAANLHHQRYQRRWRLDAPTDESRLVESFPESICASPATPRVIAGPSIEGATCQAQAREGSADRATRVLESSGASTLSNGVCGCVAPVVSAARSPTSDAACGDGGPCRVYSESLARASRSAHCKAAQG